MTATAVHPVNPSPILPLLPLPISRVLQIAAKEIGVKEVPRGSNRGPKIKLFLAATGLPEGYPWCAAFVAWVGLTASIGGVNGFDHWPLPLSADCDVLLFKARQIGILYIQPKVGDLFLLMASRDNATHVGFVTGVNGDGTIRTIEGNSNTGGSVEGYTVVSRSSRPVHNLKFARWAEVVTSVDTLTPWKIYLRAHDGVCHLIHEAAFMQQGNNYIPVRDYLQAVNFPDATLKWNAETQGLDYLGKPLPVQTIFRGDGRAWGRVRQLAAYTGHSIEIDGKARTGTLFLS
jgi:hypothetical protein